MTQIVIAAFGTRGDVAPLTGLGVRLRERIGGDVAVAAQHPYEQMVTAAGLEFRLLPKDTEQATRESAYGQAVVDGARMRPSKDVLAQMRDDLTGVGEAMATTAADADLLLFEGPIGSLLGYHVAEALDIPSIGAFFQPVSATEEFAPPPLTARSFGSWGNRMAWRLGGVGEKVYTPLIDSLRATLDLAPQSRRTYQRRRDETWPVLYGFSQHVVPRPADWRAGLDVTGYWWPVDDPAWQPPSEVVDFLQAGPPPVFVGLGSTATARSEELSAMIVAALRKAGVRGMVQSGWAHLYGDGTDIITVGDIPHAWLFPQMAAVVQHCGAGTTAAALRAGVPSIPVTGIMDQPFWARRLHALGAATAPLRRTTLTVEDLTDAITTALHDPRYAERAQHVSQLLVDEDGESKAAGIIAAQLAKSG
ncbi:glycosyltransferase [Aldersonia sp. NBC_00410]|uniref:glycosyltransferase n=1 Tax=Aldersonia sp. NBC_00410 TaxID=2975954 RepID=UPI00225A3058|nr:glycosyltransferase [Aldersonia sp. NBC_00410]MCX5044904.1 glycosyltransferase [Aldersonia sp. NBC_00410]